jgi:hypothetical protein
MHGISPLIATEAVLIMAWRFALVLSPFFAVLGLWTLVNQTDRIIHYLFPNLQWEHDLGWLNIKAERRARRAVRWLGYSAYVARPGTHRQHRGVGALSRKLAYAENPA